MTEDNKDLLNDEAIKAAFSSEFEAADISVSEDLIARTMAAIKALPVGEEEDDEIEAEKADSEKIQPVPYYLRQRPEPVRQKGYSRKTVILRWVTGIAAAVMVGIVGIAVVKNAGIKKSESNRAEYAASDTAAATDDYKSESYASAPADAGAAYLKPSSNNRKDFMSEAPAMDSTAAADDVFYEGSAAEEIAEDADDSIDYDADFSENEATSENISLGGSFLLPAENISNEEPALGTQDIAEAAGNEADFGPASTGEAADYSPADDSIVDKAEVTVEGIASENGAGTDEEKDMTGGKEDIATDNVVPDASVTDALIPDNAVTDDPATDTVITEDDGSASDSPDYVAGSTDFVFMTEDELLKKLDEAVLGCEAEEADIEAMKAEDELLEKLEPITTYYFMSEDGSRAKGIAFYEKCLVYVDSDETGSVARCFRYITDVNTILGIQ
ncbi:MAG: hypothetical protein MJ131_03970 [Lachnospiraceae bacterium]|nr:hypothetical protein [Lachnospiraceae bacterium]